MISNKFNTTFPTSTNTMKPWKPKITVKLFLACPTSFKKSHKTKNSSSSKFNVWPKPEPQRKQPNLSELLIIKKPLKPCTLRESSSFTVETAPKPKAILPKVLGSTLKTQGVKRLSIKPQDARNSRKKAMNWSSQATGKARKPNTAKPWIWTLTTKN